MRVSRRVLCVSVVAALSTVSQAGTFAQLPASLPTLRIQATSVEDLRTWDAYVTQHERAGSLRVRTSRQDPDLPSRLVERLDQFHEGIPIWGADIVRSSERGVPIAIFGELAPPDLQLSTVPVLSIDEARTVLRSLGGPAGQLLVGPELVVIRLDSGDYRLAYTAVVSGNDDVVRAFGDAQTGVELLRYSELQRQQAAVGTGMGVLGDPKKVSVQSSNGGFIAVDRLRPPTIQTFDLGGGQNGINWYNAIFRGAVPGVSMLARDTDNVWTDPAVTEAHAHVGMAYDYLFKRFGRSGLDGRNSPINIIVNALTQQEALQLRREDWGSLVTNADWCGPCFGGQGRIWFGNGFPVGYEYNGQRTTYTAAALDTVVHELVHGVTESTSNLIYSGESGALNEAFSDMMGISAEFFYYPTGSGVRQADYVFSKDTDRGVRSGVPDGVRSLENPRAYGQPDHYATYRNSPNNAGGDYGGVHINSGIANHAFYLAIQGGTNRTSAVSVSGIGSASREQIEKAYFRAFTLLMPRSANLITARAATVAAARDLYGANSAAERAVALGWSAVGVPDTSSIRVTGPGQLSAGRDWSGSVRLTGASARYIYQANLDGFDPTRTDLDLYLTSSSGCAYWTRPLPSCVLAASDSPDAFETVAMYVVPGQVFYLQVVNYRGETANPRITDFGSLTGVTLSSVNSGIAATVTHPLDWSRQQ